MAACLKIRLHMADRTDRKAPGDASVSAGTDVSAILDSILDGCFAVAADWTVTYLNRACEDYVGRPRAEILGHPVWDAHPALRGTECERQLRAAMIERVPRRVELASAVHPGRLIELRLFPTRDGLAVILRDITEEKRRDAAQRESETRFRLLANLVPAFVWMATPEGQFRFLNDRWYEYTGQTVQQALPDGWVETLHPDDRARTLVAWQRAVLLGAPYEIEMRHRRRDGSYRWYVSRAEPVRDSQGRITGWFGTSTDIHDMKVTEQALRESEARFRNLADSAPVMIWLSDSDGRCTYASRRWYEFTGETPETTLDFAWLGAVHSDDRDAVEKAFREANESRGMYRVDYRVRRHDGAWRWVIDTAAPRFGDDGSFLGFVGSVIDITERKQAEDRLKLLAREVDHRAKNILALVQVVIRQTRANSVADFIGIATGRLYALGRAHTLLSRNRWAGADFRRLVEEELAMFRIGPGERVQISGPEVRLGPEAAQSFAMALHELTTNASKHGALSKPHGTVTLQWSGGKDAPLVLRWAEHDGPAVREPQRTGVGLDVITRIIGDQLGGVVTFNWRPEGVVCDIVVPADKLASS
jgi:PAS domain S-box-containing protein